MKRHILRKNHTAVSQLCETSPDEVVPIDVTDWSYRRDGHLIGGDTTEAVTLEWDCNDIETYFLQWIRHAFGEFAPSCSRSVKLTKANLKNPYVEMHTKNGVTETMFKKCYRSVIHQVWTTFKDCHDPWRADILGDNPDWKTGRPSRLLFDHYEKFLDSGEVQKLDERIGSSTYNLTKEFVSAFQDALPRKESCEISAFKCRCGYESHALAMVERHKKARMCVGTIRKITNFFTVVSIGSIVQLDTPDNVAQLMNRSWPINDMEFYDTLDRDTFEKILETVFDGTNDTFTKRFDAFVKTCILQNTLHGQAAVFYDGVLFINTCTGVRQMVDNAINRARVIRDLTRLYKYGFCPSVFDARPELRTTTCLDTSANTMVHSSWNRDVFRG